MGCLEAIHMVLNVSVAGFSETLVRAMPVPSTQVLYVPAALVAPYLWTDGADFACSQEMPW